ncbi:hypothetical protein D3C85_1410420 [compost metagenome]
MLETTPSSLPIWYALAVPAPWAEAPKPAPLPRRLRMASTVSTLSPTAMPITPVSTTNRAVRSALPPTERVASTAKGVVMDRMAMLRCSSSERFSQRASSTVLPTAMSTEANTPTDRESQWRRISARFS